MKDVSQDLQQKDQPEGHQSLSIPHEGGEAEERPITAAGQLQQPIHPQQEDHGQETTEALCHQKQEVEDNQEQQRSSGEQIKEKCIQLQDEEHLQETHKPQTHHNQEQQTQESKELQTQHHSHEVQTQLSQDVQTQIEAQGVQTQKSQELQPHQSQEMQLQEEQTHPHKEQQTQQTPTAAQPQPSLPAPQQHQEKQLIQNQPKKHQLSEKDVEQRQQEQHFKKLKKKLVGENQERINYLVQASRAMALTAGSPAATHGQKALAAQVGSLASAVGRRCVLRIAPALKRCLCKGCGTSLVYGVNARVRHRSRRQKHLVVTCLTCHTIKRFVNDPKHKLWFEQEEAVA